MKLFIKGFSQEVDLYSGEEKSFIIVEDDDGPEDGQVRIPASMDTIAKIAALISPPAVPEEPPEPEVIEEPPEVPHKPIARRKVAQSEDDIPSL